MKIKTGQQVKVLSGKDRGKTGKVLQVFPKLEKVVVDGVNKTYKHLKQRQTAQKGERVEFFAPLDSSNVQVAEEQKTPAKKIAKKDKLAEKNS